MLTVLEAIKKSTEFLDKKGIESPRINAELLLASIMKCKRLDLYLKFDQPLDETETIEYREFVRRRSTFEPLQYIIGSVEFFNLSLKVNPDVLIPRPETELLVESVLNELKIYPVKSILDIGTGSGAIAISLTKNLSGVKITAIDNSEKALNLAEENAVKNGLPGKIEFIRFNIEKDDFNKLKRFDVVVSNPPYVSMDEYKKLQNEITKFEPPSSVTDFHDGLSFYRIIIEKSVSLLNENGLLFFEIAKDSGDFVKKLLNQNNFSEIKIIKDYSGNDRIIRGIKK